MQDRAQRVIQILIDHRSEAGVDIANVMAEAWFTEAGLHDEKYSLGLETAENNGWLIPGTRLGTIQITHKGWRAATGA
jgi:hypothetical protein